MQQSRDADRLQMDDLFHRLVWTGLGAQTPPAEPAQRVKYEKPNVKSSSRIPASPFSSFSKARP